jgi:hypothetical protein
LPRGIRFGHARKVNPQSYQARIVLFGSGMLGFLALSRPDLITDEKDDYFAEAKFLPDAFEPCVAFTSRALEKEDFFPLIKDLGHFRDETPILFFVVGKEETHVPPTYVAGFAVPWRTLAGDAVS